MAVEFFQVNLPKAFLPFINHEQGGDLDDKVKVSLAIGMFAEKQVTVARAAELAELSLADFIELLKSKSIPWAEYGEEHFKEDLQAVKELVSRKENTHG